jgi:hypothetical protein
MSQDSILSPEINRFGNTGHVVDEIARNSALSADRSLVLVVVDKHEGEDDGHGGQGKRSRDSPEARPVSAGDKNEDGRDEPGDRELEDVCADSLVALGAGPAQLA